MRNIVSVFASIQILLVVFTSAIAQDTYQLENISKVDRKGLSGPVEGIYFSENYTGLISTGAENKQHFGLASRVSQLMQKKSVLSNNTLERKNDVNSIIEPVDALSGMQNTWRKNAVQITDISPGPKIAIVIDDAGIDRKRTVAVRNLMAPLTMAFLTYADNLPEQVQKAREAGHEILVHMAMEAIDKNVDTGPNTLITKTSKEKILETLRWGLTRFTGYVGINNHMGSLFTANEFGMDIVMRELKRRGLLFLDSRTTRDTLGASIALANDVPFAERNIFLDNVPKIEAVNGQLKKLEDIARVNGYGVAIGHPRDATITALSNWLAVLAEKGFVQVPISTIVAELRGISPKNLGGRDIK